MGGKGSGPKKRCAACHESLVCASCGIDQNERALVSLGIKINKSRLDELKTKAKEQGITLSELIRTLVGE